MLAHRVSEERWRATGQLVRVAAGLVVGLLAVGAWAVGLSAWSTAEPVVLAVLAATPAMLGWSLAERAGRQRAADAWIAHRSPPPPADAELRKRLVALTAPSHRRATARSLRRVLAEAERPAVLSAQIPVDRRAVRAERARLADLISTLSDCDAPVSARGVALADDLVRSPASPLYHHRKSPTGSGELRSAVRRTLFELVAGDGPLQPRSR